MNNAALIRLQVEQREILLLGTAHISRESVDAVLELIPAEQPDVVCLEMDEKRFQALRNGRNWRSLDIIQVIRQKKLLYLVSNLVLASFQKRLGAQTGVRPGAEMAAAAGIAERENIRTELIDRDIRATLLRIWRSTGWWKKCHLLATLLASCFEKTEVDEEALARLREGDALATMLGEMEHTLPTVKTVLVDERDRYMATKILRCGGQKVLAVIGAAHRDGIARLLESGYRGEDLETLERIPEKSLLAKIVPWLIPAVVLVLFVAGFAFGDWHKASEAVVVWILANGLLAALGALIALGHPLTILSAFVAAPITSLNPMIGAGFVTALVQALVVPPTVGDMEAAGDDITTLRGCWRNRLLRLILVFILPSVGSSIGTLLSFHWLKDLL
ncbi:MAG: TraB/GumN family protein [Deltaproteobacteria bacterium]|nr:TraB/GumN family protein [Deltaproteobacteria bacterium]